MKAGESKGECQLQCDLSSLEPDRFCNILKDHRLARLKDKDGKDISPKDMPHSIGDLPNDPYRSLAYFVRKDHGICRSRMKQKEFAESSGRIGIVTSPNSRRETWKWCIGLLLKRPSS
jgi:hypothetical protein